jgi:glycine betaine transporter
MSSSSTSQQRPPAETSARPTVDRTVFGVSLVIAALFVGWGVLANDSLSTAASEALAWTISGFGWVFVLASLGFVVLSVVLAVSRFGQVRLGGDDERPEFRTVSWVAMMFSAGMGIGLMFFGAAEPLYHLTSPPPMVDVQPNTADAAETAMEYSFFHWAFHPWAMYAVVGLALAYFAFRKGRAVLVSSAFFPLIGERAAGGPGRAIDILAIFATLFGSATSLGLGALQINSGLSQLSDLPGSTAIAVGIIAALTAAFVVSAVTGVHRGIQFLSNTNMVLAVLLLAFLFVVGPTIFILNTFTESVGDYLGGFVPLSFTAGAFGGTAWLSAWTIFYWAWWISWTPFVGTFIARISRGRTIREFVLGVILVPSLVSFVWFSVMGGTAIDLQLRGVDFGDELAAGEEVALFAVLRNFPGFTVSALLVIVLVALFFVSGADAASVVMGMLSSHGSLEPRVWVTVLWGTLTGAVAIMLLLAGGLDALRTLCILAAFPFMFVMLGVGVGLYRELQKEPHGTPRSRAAARTG